MSKCKTNRTSGYALGIHFKGEDHQIKTKPGLTLIKEKNEVIYFACGAERVIHLAPRNVLFYRQKKYFETPRTNIRSSIPPRTVFSSSDLFCFAK